MTRALSDHGTAQQAIDWVLDHDRSNGLEAETFLRCWREGRLDEWPEFYEWLDDGAKA